MAEQDELDPGEDNGSSEEDIPLEIEAPKYKMETMPTGKVDQVMWYAFRGKTRKELVKPPYNFKPGTIRVGFGRLADLESEWVETQERQEVDVEEKPGRQLTAARQKSTQVFAKGAAPEAIIESISIPIVDGQLQGFEQGMKFGMSQLVLAVRVMQELSSVSLQQVKPLIDLTRSVREGETAAFKSGADEAAMKAAQAMGNTIMPIMSEVQATVASAAKGSETDPMKGMMVRTMEPLFKNVMKKLMPGFDSGPPSGFTKETR